MPMGITLVLELAEPSGKSLTNLVIFCQESTRCFSLSPLFKSTGINTLISSQTQLDTRIKVLKPDLLHNPFSRLSAQWELDLTDRISCWSKCGNGTAQKGQMPSDFLSFLPPALMLDVPKAGEEWRWNNRVRKLKVRLLLKGAGCEGLGAEEAAHPGVLGKGHSRGRC